MWLAPGQSAAGIVLLIAAIVLEIAGLVLEHRAARKPDGADR